MRDSKKSIEQLYTQPFLQLINEAHQIHTANFGSDIELCQLISVKTGGCPEDCAYCSQSNSHSSEIKVNPLLPLNEIEKQAITAKKQGVRRMCMAAAYRSPSTTAINKACEYIEVIKKHGLETCITFGSLNLEQANKLKDAGLDYYNHNIDTSPEYYPSVITTRTFQDRISTIENVGKAGIKVCCGGILGLGETRKDRISFIQALTNLPYMPDSIPINTLVRIKGTKLADNEPLDKFELVRTIATTRILFPRARIRLSAGRKELSQLEQSLRFMAGANSFWYGEKLITADNNEQNEDRSLLAKLGIMQDANLA